MSSWDLDVRDRAERQSRHESIIVLYAAKDGKGHELAKPWGRLHQFRIRIWNSVNGLGWTRPIVITNVLRNDTAKVIDAEEDKVIQRFLPQRPDEAFDVW